MNFKAGCRVAVNMAAALYLALFLGAFSRPLLNVCDGEHSQNTHEHGFYIA